MDCVKFRAFISVDIEPGEELVSVLKELVSSGADLKVVKPRLMHMTLKFLGDIEEDAVEEIHARMAQAASSEKPFAVRLRGMGAFPSMSNIRVVWVGIDDAAVLGRIANSLDVLLAELGFGRDRKGFSPHVTVARARSGRRIGAVQEIIRRNAVTEYGEYRVDRILLKKSVLGPEGPTYSTVRERELGETA